jgi:hypothetical protein
MASTSLQLVAQPVTRLKCSRCGVDFIEDDAIDKLNSGAYRHTVCPKKVQVVAAPVISVVMREALGKESSDLKKRDDISKGYVLTRKEEQITVIHDQASLIAVATGIVPPTTPPKPRTSTCAKVTYFVLTALVAIGSVASAYLAKKYNFI